MILDRLFTQYKKKRSLLFGSKWLNLHGRLFLGNPAEMTDRMGVAVEPELLKTYYYIPVNRWAPKVPGKQLKWRQDNICLTALREAERPQVAKAVGALTFAVVLGIFASQSAIFRALELGGNVKSAVTGEPKVVDQYPYDNCVDTTVAWVNEGANFNSMSSEQRAFMSECTDKHPTYREDVLAQAGAQ